MKGLLDRWDLIAALCLTAIVLLLREITALLPELVPTHYNALGHVDGWTPRGQLAIFVAGVPFSIWLVTVAVDASQRIIAKRKSLPILGLGPLRFGVVAGLSLFSLGIAMAPLLGLKSVLAPLVSLVACVSFGMWHLAQRARMALKDHQDAMHWKYGLFYHNQTDSRLWVPKALGFGWTVNFAKPAAKLLMIVALAPVVVVVVMVALQPR